MFLLLSLVTPITIASASESAWQPRRKLYDNNEETLLSAWYGGSGGAKQDVFDQGRIYGISYIVCNHSGQAGISHFEFKSDDQTFFDLIGDCGNVDTIRRCPNINLSNGECIISHRVLWSDDYVIDIEVRTNLGYIYSCESDSNADRNYFDSELQQHYGYCLVGFGFSSGAVMDTIRFQYAYQQTIAPTYTTTFEPTFERTFENNDNWIDKVNVNCADGYQDLSPSNPAYGNKCEECPTDTAGIAGKCEQCSLFEKVNHNRTYCKITTVGPALIAIASFGSVVLVVLKIITAYKKCQKTRQTTRPTTTRRRLNSNRAVAFNVTIADNGDDESSPLSLIEN